MTRRLRAQWETGDPNVDGALEAQRKNIQGRITTFIDGFFADNIAAAASAVVMNRDGWAGAWGPTQVLAPRFGYINGLFVAVNAVLTAGTLTVEIYKNTSATGLKVVYPVTTPKFIYASFTKGVSRFKPGDIFELKYTTSGGMTPTGSVDIMAGLELVLE